MSERTQPIQVEVNQSHTLRNVLVLGSAAAAALMIFEAGSAVRGHADSAPRVTAGVNHQTEVWTDFDQTCDKKVGEFVGVTGIQHNVVFGGLTSGGLKVDKALAGDFLICGSNGSIAGRREDILQGGKLVRSVLHFSNKDINIEAARVDHLDPANRAPLRANDSKDQIAKKLSDCNKQQGKDACDDTGIKIMWPKLVDEQVCLPFVGCNNVSIPGPKFAVNPDDNLKLAVLMNVVAQVAVSLDGTTNSKWQKELSGFEEEIRAQRATETGVPVTIVAEALPTETEVISQRLEALSPQLQGAFQTAKFIKSDGDATALHVEDFHGAKIDVVMSDVKPTDDTLQNLNGYLHTFNIGDNNRGDR